MGVILPLDCGRGSGTERKRRVCVRDRPKEREREREGGNKEFLSLDEEKEGKSWTIKKGKGRKEEQQKKRVG